jgi:hypothetical protein
MSITYPDKTMRNGMTLYNFYACIRGHQRPPLEPAWSPSSHARQGMGLLLSMLLASACHAEQTVPASGAISSAATGSAIGAAASSPEESRMWMTVGERRFGITLTQSPAARAMLAQLPLTLNMEDLHSNEKHAQLPKALPTQAAPAGTIRSGDFMLYGSTTLVVFYTGLNSSYEYTRLGRIDNPNALRDALGKRAVRITFSNK